MKNRGDTQSGAEPTIVRGRAYVLTRDVYQSLRIDGGPMVRVFREGERFLGTSYFGEVGLWPVDSQQAVPDNAAEVLAECIAKDEPLPGGIRDGTWARMAGMVVEIPHDPATLRVAEQCRAWEEAELRQMEDELVN